MEVIFISVLLSDEATQNSSEQVNIMGRPVAKTRDRVYYYSEWFIHILLVFPLNKEKSDFY